MRNSPTFISANAYLKTFMTERPKRLRSTFSQGSEAYRRRDVENFRRTSPHPDLTQGSCLLRAQDGSWKRYGACLGISYMLIRHCQRLSV